MVPEDKPVSEYAVLAVAPISTESLYILYPTTPTLSVEAVHDKSICDDEIAVADRLVGIEGAWVSVVQVPEQQ